jgi:exopolysaccharide biosynthesis protein
VPWTPLAKLFGIKWSLPAKRPNDGKGTLLLIQYPTTYIENIRHSVSPDKIRIVMDLSNATRVTARHTSGGITLYLAAKRRPNVASKINVGEYLVPYVFTQSGNWKASTQIKLNYAAPATWFTIGNPPRIVIDVQRLFEQANAQNIDGGLIFTKIFRGTGHGPVRIFMARVDPKKGWRLRIAPAGFSVLQRARISRIAARHKAPIGVNGGFFAFDGAALGAVKVDGEWIRLPWKGRSAIAFKPDGEAKIGNLQVDAVVRFSSGLELPIHDLNGWPDRNHITALTRHFGTFVKLRPGEIAAVVDKGVVTSTPGSGGINVPTQGFVLVANGGAIPELQKARRGLKADLKISAPGWEGYSSALGGGPRLVENGTAEVKEEGFRSDVTNGLGPRTAIGIDKEGRYIIAVADGRQGFYSTGMTLLEMAYTMQKFGAVDALNMDGGGSTAMFVRDKIANRPSDGAERSVSNALLVMR